MSDIKNPIHIIRFKENDESDSIIPDVKKTMMSPQIDVEDAKQKENGNLKETDAIFEVAHVENSDNADLQVALVEDVKREEENGYLKETEPIFLEVGPVKKSDNTVLRKLLRGPRYFDPQECDSGKCYNCGALGHTITNCTASKRTKPCYVCGSLEHNGKQCKQGKGCFICKKGGHRAKNCPDKSKEGSQKTNFCLKCGDSGHDMFTCRTVYSPDDLKEVQCFICKCFGHLCCVNYGEGPSEVSCYRCGQLGHSGLECANVTASAHAEKTEASAQSEKTDASAHAAEKTDAGSPNTPNTCCKCGEDGHRARKCPKFVKKRKRRSRVSRIKESLLKDDKDHVGIKSASPDLDEAHKKKKTQNGDSPSSQPKRRGGWMDEDLGDFFKGTSSPSDGINYRSNNSFHASLFKDDKDHVGIKSASPDLDEAHNKKKTQNGDSPFSQSKRRGGWIDEDLGDFFKGTPSPSDGINYRSNNSFHEKYGAKDYDSGFQFEPSGSDEYQHKFSASRFGNSSNNGEKEYS